MFHETFCNPRELRSNVSLDFLISLDVEYFITFTLVCIFHVLHLLGTPIFIFIYIKK